MFRKIVICLFIFMLGLLVLPRVFAWEKDPGTENAMRVKEFIARATLVDLRWLMIPQEWQKAISLKEETPELKLSEVVQPLAAQQLPLPKFAYSKFVLPLSEKYGIDWKLVAAVMAVESNYNPRVISTKGAVGLMQVMPSTAALYRISYQDLFNPKRNIEAGVLHLKMLNDRYDGDLPLVIAAYNSGEGAVDRFNGIPPYRHTKAFVRKVMARYQSHVDRERLAVSAVSDIRGNSSLTSVAAPAVAYK
ncbi:MAG TPA: lytic transglycosylase domain-containing protein [Acidobacteriota bacterium]|nr:lytic transglycosylase domain-containing protein [Acidobacteriota bacterium]